MKGQNTLTHYNGLKCSSICLMYVRKGVSNEDGGKAAQQSSPNRKSIDANSVLKKLMPKRWTLEPTCKPKVSQHEYINQIICSVEPLSRRAWGPSWACVLSFFRFNKQRQVILISSMVLPAPSDIQSHPALL